MKKYIVVVRAYEKNYVSDEKLYALDLMYVSPIVEMDYERDRCKALDEFDEKYEENFFRFLNKYYELIPV